VDSIISSLKVKLFADGADLDGMLQMAEKSYISGLTTNPTLMRKAGITSYSKFAQEVIKFIPKKPISFEVFSDDFEEMKSQGLELASWGENVYVKVPITNTQGNSTAGVIRYLSERGVKVNITAIMTPQQVEEILPSLESGVPSYISVFAGRIADTGRDPIPVMKECLELISKSESSELIWASPRELLNVFQAETIGCHIITATNDILKKLDLVGMDLDTFSLDTVKMFYEDAKNANFQIP
jgi:transaldolase